MINFILKITMDTKAIFKNKIFILFFLLLTAMRGFTLQSTQLPKPRYPTLHQRSEDPGSVCDQEGQWKCMSTSWQRCASGRWSVIMSTAIGTTCAPLGLTADFHIQSDPSALQVPYTSGGVMPTYDTQGNLMGRSMIATGLGIVTLVFL